MVKEHTNYLQNAEVKIMSYKKYITKWNVNYTKLLLIIIKLMN